MADGAYLAPGDSAVRLVVLDFKSARVLAPILLLLMAVRNVRDQTKKVSNAITAPAQVSKHHSSLEMTIYSLPVPGDKLAYFCSVFNFFCPCSFCLIESESSTVV